MTLDDIKEEINKAQDILIVTHESPDGDEFSIKKTR